MISSNYNKYPVIDLPDYAHCCYTGWPDIVTQIKKNVDALKKTARTIVVECYHGVYDDEIAGQLKQAFPDAAFFYSVQAMLSESEINNKLQPDITDDELFGYMTRYNMDCYFDASKTEAIREEISSIKQGTVIIYGTGAAYLMPKPDILIYADMARWEIQMRFRRNEISNIGISNKDERASLQYKRAFFVDWRICDRFKKAIMHKWDYVLDTNVHNQPKMATGEAVEAGLSQAVSHFALCRFSIPVRGVVNGLKMFATLTALRSTSHGASTVFPKKTACCLLSVISVSRYLPSTLCSHIPDNYWVTLSMGGSVTNFLSASISLIRYRAVILAFRFIR